MDSGFPDLVASLDYPLFVVTAAAEDGERSGCLVGFTTQCSIHPARYLVCLSRRNHTHGVAARAKALGVHLVTHHQREIAELFGTQTGDETDKFGRVPWKEGPEGTPLLDDCPNRFVGRVVERIPGGDHTVYLLDVISASIADAEKPIEPLTFQEVRDLDAGHEA